MGQLDDIDRGKSCERRKDGAGRCRRRRLKTRGDQCDQTQVIREGGEEQENDGAA